MSISIRRRIHWSFSVFVGLFIINGIITIRTLNKNNRLTKHVSTVIGPTQQKLDEFHNMLIESKMYSTNWVFLRANEEDKNALRKIHEQGYLKLKTELSALWPHWKLQQNRESLQKLLTGFEHLLSVERKIMNSLQKFEDYDDPVLKLEAEKILEDEVIPATANLTAALLNITQKEKSLREAEEAILVTSAKRLRGMIIVLAITIIAIGFILSQYFTSVILTPVGQIRNIVNDLGRGITNRIDHKYQQDEIGEMVIAVNNLSDKLSYTAGFAKQIGERKFDAPFTPLSGEDTLGKALVTMRDKLKSVDESLNLAQHIAKLGNWEWDYVNNKISWSDEMYRIFGKEPSSATLLFNDFIEQVYSDDREFVKQMMEEVVVRRLEPRPMECRIVSADGLIKTVFFQTDVVTNEKGEMVKLHGVMQDITERKQAQQAIEAKNYELQQKNRELEQFAYVTSHDLQEPLRTISSFVDQFQKMYGDQFDERGQKFMHYIVQATDRMKTLIKDLLEYSRIGRKKELATVDCNDVVNTVLADLDTAIRESGAAIRADKLPVVHGYTTEIKQLFQNLVINAIKFRKKDAHPEIHISSQPVSGGYEFMVRDNGIGIPEEHSERIFVIFQRLHTRTEYEGSGIGLSHCKKIVELHGGRIWVKSKPGEGSAFHFTILENQN